MKKINDGGRAFPWCGDLNDCPTINLGMTLRDYFAAKAMQGMFAADTVESFMPIEIKAAAAYQMADAMLAAREQSEPQAE